MYDIDENTAQELAEERIGERSGGLLAGLPTTLIISGLEEQLGKTSSGYSSTDYLSPVLDAVSLIRSRCEDPATSRDVNTAVRRILSSVVTAVEAEWGWDLSQLGFETDGSDYEGDVQELYEFFISDRVSNARDYIYASIVGDKRRIVERYKKSVEKRNQTVSEARRSYQFDDVVVWVSLPRILADFGGGELMSPATMPEVLATLGVESRLLGRLAGSAGHEYFAASYVRPVLVGALLQETIIELRTRWLADAPRKPAGDQQQEN
jgi:hypothetical protein